jgi:hypothetical protein
MMKKSLNWMMGALLLMSATQTMAADLSEGLVAYYPLSADATDSSGNGMNGTVMSGVDFSEGYAQFDGTTNAYIDLPDGFADFSDGFSFSGWVRYDSLDETYSRIFDFSAGGEANNNIVLCHFGTSSNLYYRLYSDATPSVGITEENVFEPEAWQYISLVHSADENVSIYLNGSLVVSTNGYSLPDVVERVDNFLGKSNWDNSDGCFKGAMKELRFYDRSLSSNEVSTLYSAAPTSYAAPIVDITTTNQTVDWTSETIELSGTNSASVTSLSWTNGANAAFGDLSVSGFEFKISDLPLATGTNLISVIGKNGLGQQDSDQIEIVRADAPLAVIDILTTNQTVAGETDTIELTGTNNQWIVGTLVWTNAANGESGQFPVSSLQFQVSAVPLSIGANTVTVTGTNALGTAVSDAVIITRSSESGADNPTHYVSQLGSHTWPFDNWDTAATNIQAAVDAAADGDTVLVDYGDYQEGATITIAKAITLESLYGEEWTTIDGEDAYRCLTLSDGACIDGFTIQNGSADSDESLVYGGGIYCSDSTVQNCIVFRNSATYGGGGIYCAGGFIKNSSILDNIAGNINSRYDYSLIQGAGIYCANSIVQNCVISGNSVDTVGIASAGGIYCTTSTVKNCTISKNSVSGYGGGGPDGPQANGSAGGIYCGSGGNIQNCIVSVNTAQSYTDNYSNRGGNFNYTCTTPSIGDNCITDDPQLAGCKLTASSPCIDAGMVINGITTDIDGTPRPLDGDGDGVAAPDIGAYEYVNLSADSDGDGLTDGQELVVLGTSPVKSHSDDDPASDYNEYIAGTDPRDGSDWFHITGLSGTAIEFTTSANRSYTLQSCTNLVAGTWMDVPDQINIPGSGGIDTLSDASTTNACFYRVQVELP